VELESGDYQYKLTDHEVAGLRDFLSDLGFRNLQPPP
jgi:hypothetical protein